MTDFIMPVFDTVQAAAEYGRPESVLREMMKALRPGAKTFVFIANGSVYRENRVHGMPSILGHYHTVAYGGVASIACSTLAIGDIHTDVNGVTWEVVANHRIPGTASVLGSHMFCAVEVVND
jgi:hypothetical protein